MHSADGPNDGQKTTAEAQLHQHQFPHSHQQQQQQQQEQEWKQIELNVLTVAHLEIDTR